MDFWDLPTIWAYFASLLYLSIRLNEIGNQCNELSEEVYWMREYPASELIVGAEEWAKPEINRTMCAEVEKKLPN